jgi:hypothetical protein
MSRATRQMVSNNAPLPLFLTKPGRNTLAVLHSAMA